MLDCGLQYYLSARLAFRNNMLKSGMMNAFWAMEYFLLSSLCLKYKSLDELKAQVPLHNLDVYWREVGKILSLPEPIVKRFQPTISQVNSFFKLRYPVADELKSRVVYVGSGKKPKMTDGKGNNVYVEESYKIDLNKIDHFASFWLFHFSSSDSGSLAEWLASYNCNDTYRESNKYSLSPPAQYNGEKELDQ